LQADKVIYNQFPCNLYGLCYMTINDIDDGKLQIQVFNNMLKKMNEKS